MEKSLFYFRLLHHQYGIICFNFLAEMSSSPTLLPYQPGPPSDYLEHIRSGRKMLEEVIIKSIYFFLDLSLFLARRN